MAWKKHLKKQIDSRFSLSADTIDHVVQLRKAGGLYREIKDQTGLRETTVEYIIRKYCGTKMRQGVERLQQKPVGLPEVDWIELAEIAKETGQERSEMLRNILKNYIRKYHNEGAAQGEGGEAGHG